ncbi:hypothetical protein ES707_08798 [subsurface metagenome]
MRSLRLSSIIICMKRMHQMLNRFAELVLKLLKACFRPISSEMFWQTMFLLAPFIFLSCIPILNDLFTWRQIGILFQAFTVIPLIPIVWEQAHRSVWEFNWYVTHLRNWCFHRGWESIAGWLSLHSHRLSKLVLVYLLSVAIMFHLVGLLLQLFI